MKKGMTSYVGALAITFALIALFPSEISMWIGAIIFVFMGAVMPLGINFLLGGIAVTLFSVMSGNMLLGAVLALSYVLTGISEGLCIKNQKSYSVTVIVGSLVRLGTMSLYYYCMSLVAKTTVRDMILGGVPKAFEEYLKSADHIVNDELMAQSLKLVEMMLPSMLCITAITFAFVAFAGAMFILKRRHIRFAWIRQFRDIKMDKAVTACYILMMAAAFVAEGNFKVILLNAVYVLSAVYTLCGIAAMIKLVKENAKIKSTGMTVLIIVVSGIFTMGLIYPILGIAASFIRKDE